MPNRIRIPDDEMRSLYEGGMSSGELAAMCGVTDTAILQRLRKIGVQRRSFHNPQQRHPKGKDSPVWKGGRRIAQNGYVIVLSPGHPRAKTLPYVPEHILIAEKALGRFLPASCPVHHVNQIRSDNTNRNLVVCQDDAYHKLLHVRQKVINAGGKPDLDKWCWKCKMALPKIEFHRDVAEYDGLRGRCKGCSRKYDVVKGKVTQNADVYANAN